MMERGKIVEQASYLLIYSLISFWVVGARHQGINTDTYYEHHNRLLPGRPLTKGVPQQTLPGIYSWIISSFFNKDGIQRLRWGLRWRSGTTARLPFSGWPIQRVWVQAPVRPTKLEDLIDSPWGPLRHVWAEWLRLAHYMRLMERPNQWEERVLGPSSNQFFFFFLLLFIPF